MYPGPTARVLTDVTDPGIAINALDGHDHRIIFVEEDLARYPLRNGMLPRSDARRAGRTDRNSVSGMGRRRTYLRKYGWGVDATVGGSVNATDRAKPVRSGQVSSVLQDKAAAGGILCCRS